MKIKSTVLTLTFATVAIAVSSAAERFPWLTDLDAARELAAAEDKPMLIVFRCEP